MANFSWPRIRKTLESMDGSELLSIVKSLYDLNATNKAFLARQFDEDASSDALAEPVRREIEKAFFKERGFPSFKTGAARKKLREYIKMVSLREGIDMMLYYVEKGIQGTNAYGDIDEAFYNSVESVFEQALKAILKTHNPEMYLPRLRALVTATRNIGWGFHDNLSDWLEEFEAKIDPSADDADNI
jgi:hypothetical protein